MISEQVEPNKNIQSLLRFMDGKQRLKIRGALGSAIIFKMMAEIIRRMSEFVFETQLPEEDELGFGLWVQGAKRQIYSTNRIFDANTQSARRQFLRTLDLDPAIRIRIYVEGPTEYYALNYILESYFQIEIINLNGQFIQLTNKGLAFRENLISDDRNGIFSVIFLDQDREDNLRVVKTAARNDIFCGLMYISDPDFEFENFTTDELTEIVWGFIPETELNDENRRTLVAALQGQTNSRLFLNAARRSLPSLNQLGKGKDWGERLARYAINNPTFRGIDTLRPFIDACQEAIHSIDFDYNYHRVNFRVDPETGKLIRRQ